MAKDHDFELFLSYSRKDLPWVEDFTQALRKAGVRAWFDAAEIPLGERWEKLIQEALRKSQTLIIVLSRNNVGSPWTFFELGAAFADNKRIVPVLMEEVDWQQIPLPLKRYQFLQESSPQIAAQRVAEVLEKQPAATSRSAVGTK